MSRGREDLPPVVRDQVDAARRARPPAGLVDEVMTEVRGSRQVQAWPAWLRGTLMGLGATATIFLVAFLVARPFSAGTPSATYAATSARPAVPSGGQLVTTEHDGFRLELWTDRTTYAADEPIAVAATLTYIGPQESVTVYHGEPIITFDLVELTGHRQMMGGVDDVCRQTVLRRGVPLTIPFSKGASWEPGDPNAAFYRQWMADPELRLPAGMWNVLTQGQFSLGSCGKAFDLGTKLSVTVTLPAGVTPTPSPTATPAVPEVTGSAISSAHDYRIEGWSPDGRWLAAFAGTGINGGGDIRIFDASGREVASLPGVAASWVSADVLAILGSWTGPDGATVALHHVSTGVDETIPGRYSGIAGSGTGRLALTIADTSGQATTFKLLGSSTVYPGYPIQPNAWDPTGRWLAVREVSDGGGGPGTPYPLALLDAESGQLAKTSYQVGAVSVFFSADGRRMLTTIRNPAGAASPYEVVALLDPSRPLAAAMLHPSSEMLDAYAGPSLPDGRWLVTNGDLEVRVWDPATGQILRLGRGYAAPSRRGTVAFLHDAQEHPPVGLELDPAAGVETIGVAGPGFMSPVWSPAGDRLAYVGGTEGNELFLLVP